MFAGWTATFGIALLITGCGGDTQLPAPAPVTAGQTLLAEISRDDPAWVYFSLSEADLLAYQRR